VEEVADQNVQRQPAAGLLPGHLEQLLGIPVPQLALPEPQPPASRRQTPGPTSSPGDGAQALVNVTIPEAHHPVTTSALFAGLPVLGEKPAAEDVSRALSLAAAAEVTGELFMVSQSRRWNPQLSTLRSMTAHLGAVGTVTTEFFRAPHFGGFRDQMAHPLLVDMAIHAFDSARFLLDAEPLSTHCQTYNGVGTPGMPTPLPSSRWSATPATSSTAAGAARVRKRRGTVQALRTGQPPLARSTRT
jgi:predicted dehydrogenase